MEANEMMLGDWVSFNGEPVKVQQVVSGINELDYEPIPLTAEILEKNGFVLMTNFYRLSVNDVYDEVIVDAKISEEGCCRVSAEHCSDEIIEAEISAKLWYVHELQHIMRLCGIKQEIVL